MEKLSSPSDMSVAHWTARKCDSIVRKTLAAFYAAAAEWGSLSLDERFGIALTLTMNIAVGPFENASTDRRKMRRELARQFRLFIEKGTEREN